jgi:ribosomal-protein-alanine N-acetyltransferase
MPMGDVALESDRLILRHYLIEDRDAFLELVCDPVTMLKMDGAKSLDSARALFELIFSEIDENMTAWAIEMRATGQYIGHAWLKRESKASDAELGYVFSPSSWGNGFATEAVRRLMDYCSEKALSSRIFATVDTNHAPSIQVLQKAGFELEETKCDEDDPDTPYGVFAKYFG